MLSRARESEQKPLVGCSVRAKQGESACSDQGCEKHRKHASFRFCSVSLAAFFSLYLRYCVHTGQLPSFQWYPTQWRAKVRRDATCLVPRAQRGNGHSIRLDLTLDNRRTNAAASRNRLLERQHPCDPRRRLEKIVGGKYICFEAWWMTSRGELLIF